MRGVQEVQIPRHGWQQEMLASYQTSSTHTANPPRPNSRVQEFVKLWANAVMQNLAKPKKRVGGSDVEGMEGVKVPEGIYRTIIVCKPMCPYLSFRNFDSLHPLIQATPRSPSSSSMT